MSHTLRGSIAFKRFLVFFWCVWWLVFVISHLAGLMQFWGWLPGKDLTSNYVNISNAIGAHHFIFNNTVFVISLLLQLIAAIHFLRALMSMGNKNWNHNANHAFVYSLSIFLVIYAGHITLEFLGTGFTSHTDNIMEMIVLNFLSTLFISLA